jgi:hypothetical protein
MADPVPRYPTEDLKERPPGLINSLTFGLLGGGDSQTARDIGVVPERKYPGEEELRLGRSVDQFYGDPRGGGLEAGSKAYSVDIRRAPEIVNDKRFDGVNWEKIDEAKADRLYTAAIAANKSPLAGLGFDPRHFVATAPQDEKRMTAAGAYMTKPDMSWIDEKFPSTYVHESVHRGLEMLTKAGYLAATPQEAKTSGKIYVAGDGEEMIVRGIMLRNFGDAEKTGYKLGDEQIEQARKLFENPKNMALIDKLEGMAARLVQERTPMGPR